MAARARALTGLPVKTLRFDEFSAPARYDGIWCCASLLHVAEAELPETFTRLAQALKPGGVWYLSFKRGSGEREQSGRRFTDLTEARLRELIEELDGVTLQDIWLSEDKRPGRHEVWVNGLVRRK